MASQAQCRDHIAGTGSGRRAQPRVAVDWIAATRSRTTSARVRVWPPSPRREEARVRDRMRGRSMERVRAWATEHVVPPFPVDIEAKTSIEKVYGTCTPDNGPKLLEDVDNGIPH